MSLAIILDQETNGGLDNRRDSGQGARSMASGSRQKIKLKDEPLTEATSIPLDPLDDMETPEVVQVMLGRLKQVPSGRAKDYEREFKLSYYYEGFRVAVIASDRGPAVIASGSDEEVAAALDALSRQQCGQATILTPQPLRAIMAQLMATSHRKTGTGR